MRNWIIITLLFEKILKESMIDKKIDEKEALEIKNIYNHYLEKRGEKKKITSFKEENIFGDVISKYFISNEQINKLNSFFSQNNVNNNFSMKINLFKSRKKEIVDHRPSAPPEF